MEKLRGEYGCSGGQYITQLLWSVTLGFFVLSSSCHRCLMASCFDEPVCEISKKI